MDKDTKKKLVFAILQGDDYEQVVRELNKNGFYVTLLNSVGGFLKKRSVTIMIGVEAVSYTHLRAHETGRNLVCRLLLEKKKKKSTKGRRSRLR